MQQMQTPYQSFAASLSARTGKILGEFHWILWRVTPVTEIAENTAFQELAVEVAE